MIAVWREGATEGEAGGSGSDTNRNEAFWERAERRRTAGNCQVGGRLRGWEADMTSHRAPATAIAGGASGIGD
jgi:hypothetical protein